MCLPSDVVRMPPWPDLDRVDIRSVFVGQCTVRRRESSARKVRGHHDLGWVITDAGEDEGYPEGEPVERLLSLRDLNG